MNLKKLACMLLFAAAIPASYGQGAADSGAFPDLHGPGLKPGDHAAGRDSGKAPPPPPGSRVGMIIDTPAAPSGVLLDKVVAVVNEGMVTESELEEQTRTIRDRLAAQKTQLPPDDVMR